MSEQSRGSTGRSEEPEIVVTTAGGQQPQVDDEGLDALLDEIDDVLETNAEEFVRSFVQKGGQ